MKKFLNTMLVTAAVVAASTTAQAATAGKVAQGAYLGASAGVANTNVKYNAVAVGALARQGTFTGTAAEETTALNLDAGKMAGLDESARVANTNVKYNAVAVGALAGQGTFTGTAAEETTARNLDAGKMAGIFGLVAGYNFQTGSLVFGGEIYGGFDSTKVTVLSDAASGPKTDQANAGTLTVKRTNFMGFAPRLGFMIAPNTLMYARLGVEFGKWKATVNPNQSLITACTTATALTNRGASQAVQTASKGGMSFAPGLGMEVYMGKAFLRAQYSYLFGPKINLSQNMKGYDGGYFNGDFYNHSMKMTQHKVELAVGYKF